MNRRQIKLIIPITLFLLCLFQAQSQAKNDKVHIIMVDTFATFDGNTLHLEAVGKSFFIGKNAGASNSGGGDMYNIGLGNSSFRLIRDYLK